MIKEVILHLWRTNQDQYFGQFISLQFLSLLIIRIEQILKMQYSFGKTSNTINSFRPSTIDSKLQQKTKLLPSHQRNQDLIHNISLNRPFLNIQSLSKKIQIEKPKRVNIFAPKMKQSEIKISSLLNQRYVKTLKIREDIPDEPVSSQQNNNLSRFYSKQKHIQISQKQIKEISLQKIQKQNFENFSNSSKRNSIMPTTAPLLTTQRLTNQNPTSSVSITSRVMQEQITFRTIDIKLQSQIDKHNLNVQHTNSSSQGFLSIFSCFSNYSAEKQMLQSSSKTSSNKCSCCHRDVHEPSISSQGTINNFQKQKKRILYGLWLQARSRENTLPKISFQQAFKRHKFLKQAQFSLKIRQYFY